MQSPSGRQPAQSGGAEMARTRGEAHVRIYAHEMRTDAWRTLSPAARALLVEMRGLYDGRSNRVHMSIRQAMSRLGVGRWAAEHAISELVERGWIRLIERGTFARKVRHASVYALQSEPLEDRDGAVAPKDYMR